MPSRSISSSNFSGVHFNDNAPVTESAPVTQNIFAPTEKQRSAPHFMSSVAPGNERQNLRSCSIFMKKFYRRDRRGRREIKNKSLSSSPVLCQCHPLTHLNA